MTTNTLQIIADSMKTPFLGSIINTTNAVLKNIQVSLAEDALSEYKAYKPSRLLTNTKRTVFSFWSKSTYYWMQLSFFISRQMQNCL
jgi:hypothetical protein